MAENALPRRDESPGPWKILWRKLLKNRVACTGGVLLIVFYVTACLAGFLAPYPYDETDENASRVAPMLLGGYVLTEREVTSKSGKTSRVFEREWRWFEGGVHFHDAQGNFTLRPHVHPLVEKKYEDEHGDDEYVHGIADTSVSLPLEFLVDSGEPHEVASLLGFFPVEGRTRLFGVRRPDGLEGVAKVYLLGSDEQGRDLFSRILHGAQISLSVGVVCILITMTLGMLVGGLSGYLGGWFDVVAMRVVEVILSVPGLYLMIVLGGIVREWRPGGRPMTSKGTYFVIVGVMAFVGWAGRARVIRGMVLSLRQNDYVVAARALGVSTRRIIVRHVLPNTFSFAIVSASLAIPGYILGEVALSFLGLGIQEPEASWGNMLRSAKETSTLLESPWTVAPGVFIFLTVLAFNFLGDGLRDAADPRAVIVRRKKA